VPETDNQSGYSGPVLTELGAMRAQMSELARIPALLSDLRDAMAQEQERAAFREEIIDRLHTENQQLRRSEVEAALEPVRAGLYRLYDLAQREADRWEMGGEDRSGDLPSELPSGARDSTLYGKFAKQVGSLFAAFAEEVVEVLGRTGVEPFEVSRGERYDSALHRPVDTMTVDDPAWDGVVIETVSSGFVRGEQIARRADVVVGQHAAR
jgi:hypothetical protein